MFARITLFVLLLLSIPCFASRAEASPDDPPIRPVQSSHPLDGVSAFPLRMTYDTIRTGYPIVFLKINGGDAKPFFLDTGYSGTILINETVARSIGLQVVSTGRKNTDVNGVSESIRYAAVNKVEAVLTNNGFFTLETPFVSVSKLDLSDETVYPFPAVGIIGMGCFREMTVHMNFEKQSLLLIAGTHPDVGALKNSITLPLTFKNDAATVGIKNLFGTDEEAVLDTGIMNTELSPKTIQQFQPTRVFIGNRPGAFSVVSGVKFYAVDRVKTENLELKNLLLFDADRKSLLGSDILSRFRVTIDTRRGKVVLEPTYTLTRDNERSAGYSGIVLVRRSGEIRITAAPASFREIIGSRLESVDGTVVKDIPLAQAQAILNGYAGTKATITVSLSGVPKQVTVPRMTLSELYDSRE